jgi:enoyl-[acyl-carrier protein] reductase II
MGTRFIASEEARAGKRYRDAIVAAGSADTIVTRCYSGKPMRVLRNAYVDDWERRPDEIRPFPIQSGVSARAGVFNLTVGDHEDLDPARSCLPMGQGCGGIDEVLPAGEIVRRVVEEAERTIREMSAALSR